MSAFRRIPRTVLATAAGAALAVGLVAPAAAFPGWHRQGPRRLHRQRHRRRAHPRQVVGPRLTPAAVHLDLTLIAQIRLFLGF